MKNYITKLSIILFIFSMGSCAEKSTDFIEISIKNGDQFHSPINQENPKIINLESIEKLYDYNFLKIKNVLKNASESPDFKLENSDNTINSFILDDKKMFCVNIALHDNNSDLIVYGNDETGILIVVAQGQEYPETTVYYRKNSDHQDCIQKIFEDSVNFILINHLPKYPKGLKFTV